MYKHTEKKSSAERAKKKSSGTFVGHTTDRDVAQSKTEVRTRRTKSHVRRTKNRFSKRSEQKKLHKRS